MHAVCFKGVSLPYFKVILQSFCNDIQLGRLLKKWSRSQAAKIVISLQSENQA